MSEMKETKIRVASEPVIHDTRTLSPPESNHASNQSLSSSANPGLPHIDNDSGPKSFLGKLVYAHLQDLDRDPTVLVTSYKVSSQTLFWFRLFGLFWVLFIVPWSLARGNGETYLFYFTNLTWLGLGLWFAVSAFQTRRYVVYGTTNLFLNQSKFTKWLTWNIYLMPATFHWIVPIVYWALLSKKLIEQGGAMNYWVNVNVHAVDLVLVFIEFYLNRVPMFYSQWPSVLGAGVLFMAYAFVQNAAYTGYDAQS
ncbi:hypothetical protein BC832DRAFT_459418 [Gaertneriomyces semiglobifer]|nr:hypothetical protein BC832DRAFT_459418 [Gaertneriomyces semiglobifer]